MSGHYLRYKAWLLIAVFILPCSGSGYHTRSGEAATNTPLSVSKFPGERRSTPIAWPKSHHDLRNTSRSPLCGPRHGKVVWRTLISPRYGRNIMSSPVVDAQGNIYVGSQDHHLYSLAPQGAIRWKFLTGHEILWSSPLLTANETIYIPSQDGFLYAVSTKGVLRWKYEMKSAPPSPTRAALHSSPAIARDGSVYIGTWVGENGPDDRKASVFYALSSHGKRLWSRYVDGQQWACPAISDQGQVYLTTDRWLYAFNTRGGLLWRMPAGSSKSPVLTKDGTVLVSGANEDYLYAIQPRPVVHIRWKKRIRPVTSPALGRDGTVYIGCQDGIRALTRTGRVKWHRCIGRRASGFSPTVDRDDNVYIGFWEGWLYSFTKHGKLRWRLKVGGEATGSAPVIGAPGRIYLGGRDRYLYAIE
jgi:outer membrane protein assembly factor BamB